MFSCEYCKLNVDDSHLIILPCGYLACYEHFIEQPDPFTCFKCKEHSVKKNVCFSIKKNREKINAINRLTELKDIRSKLNEIKQVKDDPKNFVHDVVSGVINKIDLRREQIKLEINNKIDSYFDKIYSEAQNLIDEKTLNTVLGGLDLKQIEDSIEKTSSNLDEIKSNKIEPILKKLEKIKNLDFVVGNFKFQFDGEKMFGKISNTLNSESIPIRKSNEQKIVKKSKVLTEIPAKKFYSSQFSYLSVLEMKNGELLSVSKQNPTNLVISNYETESLRELTGHAFNICLFKLNPENLIVSLSNDYQVRVWENEKCVKFYQIPQTPIYSFQVDSNKMIIYDTLNYITIKELLTGRSLRTFQGHSSPVTCLKLIKTDHILSCHKDKMIKLWDTSKRKCILEFLTEAKVVCLDIIDQDNFITGEEGGIVCIWNLNGGKLRKTQTGTKPVRLIKSIGKNKFLSYSDGGLLRLWAVDRQVFYVDDRSSIEGLKFIDVLSNKKMLTCSDQGVATIWS